MTLLFLSGICNKDYIYIFSDELRLLSVGLPVKLTGKNWIHKEFSLVILEMQTEIGESQ
jgi:hypothetical protein